jgi:hypothetical protein
VEFSYGFSFYRMDDVILQNSNAIVEIFRHVSTTKIEVERQKFYTQIEHFQHYLNKYNGIFLSTGFFSMSGIKMFFPAPIVKKNQGDEHKFYTTG